MCVYIGVVMAYLVTVGVAWNNYDNYGKAFHLMMVLCPLYGNGAFDIGHVPSGLIMVRHL